MRMEKSGRLPDSRDDRLLSGQDGGLPEKRGVFPKMAYNFVLNIIYEI